MGAVALSNIVTGVTHDGRRMKEATVAGSSSYAAGGETVPLGSLGLSEVRRIEVITQNTGGFVFVPVLTDPKAPKIRIERRTDASALAEFGTGASAASHTARLRFIGS